MCSPVGLIFCFIKLFLSPAKMVIGVAPIKTVIGIPAKVIYLHDTVIFCLNLCCARCLYLVLV